MAGIPQTVEKAKDRMLSKRFIDDNNCWNWTGHTNGIYGDLTINGRRIKIHRLSAHIWLDFDLDSEFYVCHHCDNTLCFNPDHLFVGTQKDNLRDCVNKNRQQRCKGKNHSQVKLTEEDVYTIRYLYSIMRNGERKYSRRRLGNVFNVTKSAIQGVVTGKNWRHI